MSRAAAVRVCRSARRFSSASDWDPSFKDPWWLFRHRPTEARLLGDVVSRLRSALRRWSRRDSHQRHPNRATARRHPKIPSCRPRSHAVGATGGYALSFPAGRARPRCAAACGDVGLRSHLPGRRTDLCANYGADLDHCQDHQHRDGQGDAKAGAPAWASALRQRDVVTCLLFVRRYTSSFADPQ